MKSVHFHRAGSASELADLLGLDQVDAFEFEFRTKLIKKITDEVKLSKLTLAILENRAKVPLSRIKTILSGNTAGVPTDLLLRVLYSLGYQAKVSFVKTKKFKRARVG